MIPEHAETLRRKREAGEKNTSLFDVKQILQESFVKATKNKINNKSCSLKKRETLPKMV